MRKFSTSKKQPSIFLIGGASGTGKSTLAREINLGSQFFVIGMDLIREVVRQYVSREDNPFLFCGTYELYPSDEPSDLSDHQTKDQILLKFLQSERLLWKGIEGLLKRSSRDSVSIILEGHYLVGKEKAVFKAMGLGNANVKQVVIDIDSIEEHKKIFLYRQDSHPNRPTDAHLRGFSNIRIIRDYIIKNAKALGIPIIQNFFGEVETTKTRLTNALL